LRSRIFYTLLIFFLPVFLFSQDYLNLDFERVAEDGKRPMCWGVWGLGYKIEVDPVIKYSGKYSLFMEKSKYSEGSYGCCLATLPISMIKKEKIIFKGYIKTLNVNVGYAGLWIRIDGKEKSGQKEILGFDNMRERGIKGTTDWIEVTIELHNDPDAQSIAFGAIFSGSGMAWFDSFTLTSEDNDGTKPIPKPLSQKGEKSEWLKDVIIPIKSVNIEEDTTDLSQLREIFSNAKIIGLGDVTYGSSEIFKMKHRLVKYLRENCGFDIFSIDANMPEAYLIDDYVLNAKGNPVDFFKGLGFDSWNVQEVLDLVNWMKEYNLKNDKKIHFTGFDMLSFEGAISELEKITKNNNSDILSDIENLKSELFELKKITSRNEELSESVRQNILRLTGQAIKIKLQINVKMKLKKDESEWMVQNIDIIMQYLLNSARYQRDKFMADNVKWILKHNPNSKIILWAHNSHIQKSDESMGSFLKEKFKEKYLSIGFTFNMGSYSAEGKNGLSTYKAEESFPGTFEYYFQSFGIPIFALDLRKIPTDNPDSKWIFNNLKFRYPGAKKMANEFRGYSITNNFDIIIFINESSSTKVLK
jgi:erythromycin esterase